MNYKTVVKVMGHLLLFLSLILMFPAGLAYLDGSIDLYPFLKSIGYSFVTGILLTGLTWRHETTLTPKEGFTIVSFSWLILTSFGALPFYLTELSGEYQFSYGDAYFETMSGLTTTGASILTEIESLPRGLLLWRSLTHWIGGMGIIVLFLAILPAMGAGGFQLFRAEIPGPSKDKVVPKVSNTAKILWSVYLSLSILCFFAYQLLGMDWFDAACHSFATIATGGFSTKNNSLAFWNNWQIELVATVFMFLSGCNFMLYLQILKGKWSPAIKNSELRLYITLILSSMFFIILTRYIHEPTLSIIQLFREVSFTVVSLITSTGFITADFDTWPLVCHIILIVLMLTGACAGSTGGGIKVFRIFIAIKIGFLEIAQLVHPRAVFSLKMDGQGIQDRLLRVILGFVCLYFIMIGWFTFIIVAIEGQNYDLVSLGTVCISCLSNIGPGFNSLGPTESYGNLSNATKWCLSFLMLLGRLEIYSVLVLFNYKLWRR